MVECIESIEKDASRAFQKVGVGDGTGTGGKGEMTATITGAMARLTPEQQRRVQAAVWDYITYAEAKRWNAAHLPKQPPAGRKSCCALDNIPSAEWGGAER